MRVLFNFILFVALTVSTSSKASINNSFEDAKKLNLEALDLISHGQFHKAEIKLFQSQNIISVTKGEKSYEKAKLDNDFGILYSMWEKPAEGEHHFLRALEVMQITEGVQSEYALMILENLSDLYGKSEQYDKSKQYLSRLTELYAIKYGTTSSELAKILHKLARLEEDNGKYDTAKTLYER
ncbi:MAG: tetratricopeptide repeat protein, partial [Rickettsiales bacterium]|nr:tetratricopeptide repeat protein [Rickettsiales bacterium]